MTAARSSSRVAKVDAGKGVAKKDVAGRVVEPLAPVSASSSGIAMLAQAKLSVGRVDDPAELEADQMAQKFSQWNGAGGSVEVSEGSSGGDAMRSADTGTLETGGFEVGADVQSEISSRSGRGVPLADDQRSKFEQFFGKDLSAVRVHADSDASQLSGSLGAEAFTVGNDVYFGSGRYQSGASDKLLAHELTHVVQQNSTINRWPKWLDKLRGKNQAPAAPAGPSPFGDTGVRHNPIYDNATGGNEFETPSPTPIDDLYPPIDSFDDDFDDLYPPISSGFDDDFDIASDDPQAGAANLGSTNARPSQAGEYEYDALPSVTNASPRLYGAANLASTNARPSQAGEYEYDALPSVTNASPPQGGSETPEPIYDYASVEESAGNTGHVKRLAENYKAEIEKKNQRNSKPRRYPNGSGFTSA